ncbi:MAG: hypothetical protein HWE16_11395 [Gammaproteobacteria bacterium]|nr:hypothetical protein [Gammaproteobacteria bacterium]
MKPDQAVNIKSDQVSANDILQYIHDNKIKRLYTTNNPAWTFDILDNYWQLGTYQYVKLDFLDDLNLSPQMNLSLRMVIADVAENLSFGTTLSQVEAIKAMGSHWNSIKEFKTGFNEIPTGYRRRLMSYFKKLNKSHLKEMEPLKLYFTRYISFLSKQKYPTSEPLRGIFDPENGIYTDEELSEIYQKLRISVHEIIIACSDNKRESEKVFDSMKGTLGLILLVTIFRRPSQLAQLKWVDILPVGHSFQDQPDIKKNSCPISEPQFTDLEQFHLRTFKSKRGGSYREYAEHRSIRLEPELTQFILLYREYYKEAFRLHLQKEHISLTEQEFKSLFLKLPLIPRTDFLKIQYINKDNLINSFDYSSDSGHYQSRDLNSKLYNTSTKLRLKSSRVDSFNISNNRSRHTVITNAIEKGLTNVQAATITGVCPDAIKSYANLDFNSRQAINESMAENKILKAYAKYSVEELHRNPDFTIRNELDEAQGVACNQNQCSSCMSNLSKPLGCYGCDNFVPFLDADHQSNLKKIEAKIAFNQQSSPDGYTLKKLQNSQLYCKAVINLIDKIKPIKPGMEYAE